MGPELLIASLIMSALGQGVGAIGSAGANRKIDDFINQRSADITSAFNKEYNTNIFDTAMGQSIVQQLRNNFLQSNKAFANNAAIGGRPVEADIASRDKFKQSMDNALLQLAGQDTQRKDMLTRQKDARLDNMASLMLQNLIGKSQNWTNFGNNVSGAASGMAMAGAIGALK